MAQERGENSITTFVLTTNLKTFCRVRFFQMIQPGGGVVQQQTGGGRDG